jgi:hypothetical protein
MCGLDRIFVSQCGSPPRKIRVEFPITFECLSEIWSPSLPEEYVGSFHIT